MPPTKPFTAPKAMDETVWRQHLHRVVAFAPRLLASRELNLELNPKRSAGAYVAPVPVARNGCERRPVRLHQN
jgi:hypothetical protein